MCNSLILGWFLIILGSSIVINIVFGINIPVIKIFFASLLIYLGVRILLPGQFKSRCEFKYKKFKYENLSNQDTYDVSFSSSTIDLSNLKDLTAEKSVLVRTSFANAIVILPSNIPVHVKADISFGNINMPDKKMSSEYVNMFGNEKPLLNVIIDCNFSSVSVRY